MFYTLYGFGLALVPANVISRVLAGVSGFYLNGHWTFKRGLSWMRLRRFALFWAGATVLSTVLLKAVEFTGQREQWQGAYMLGGKIAVEVAVFFTAFWLARIWVFAPEKPAGENRPGSAENE